jgi:transcriptional regulator with XRE-family HTH domain
MRDSGDPVGPGQALAAARREAGLTVAEVSQKTRIREAIIRGIERDDYSACGGDFYARGHIRAMARATGADPDPLIREYDAAHRGPGNAADRTDQFPVIRGPFEPVVAPAGPAAYRSLGNFQLVDEEPDEADPAGPRYDGEADAGHEPTPYPYGTSPGYRAPAASRGGSVSYGASENYGAVEAFGAAEVYGTREAYEGGGKYFTDGVDDAAESHDELGDAASAHSGTSSTGGTDGSGRPDGYRRVDELTRDLDGSYKFGEPHEAPGGPYQTGAPFDPGGPHGAPGGSYQTGAPFDPGGPHEAPGEPPSIGGDRSWFLGLTEPPDPGQPARPGGPTRPARPAGPRGPGTDPRRPGRWAAVTLVLLAALGLVAYFMLSNSGSTPSANSGSPSGKATSHRAGHSPSPGHTTSPPSSASPPQVFHPVSAVAFGPSGAGQGDNPQLAQLAIDRPRGTHWETDWYATARFGNLQRGTGLLLDMGHPVTITGAQVTLGPSRGADFQLRAGSAPTRGSLRTVASAANAAGVVHLHTRAPVTARYLLIWFTKLPPNPSGNFQARVYDVKVQ